MSETTQPETVETPSEATKPAVQQAPAQETTDWKAEARKWEARAKENSGAAQRLKELEEANKTEAEKLAERAAIAEAKVAEFEAREQISAWKAEVAQATSVPVEALRGSTREEIEAHASTLSSLISPEGPKGAVGPYVPPEGTSLGVLTGTPADEFAEAVRKALP